MRFAMSLLCFLSLITSAGAWAETFDFDPAVRTVAELHRSGGFTRVPTINGVRILSDGKIMGFQQVLRPAGPETQDLLATLSANSLSEVLASMPETAGALETSNAPICADAPTTVYMTMKSEGQPIEIGRNQDCRMLRRLDYQGRSIIELLDAFDGLRH